MRWNSSGVAAAVPAPQAGHHVPRPLPVRMQDRRRVEHELVADQPARIVARRVVVEAAQVIRRAVRKGAVAAEVEQPDLGAAARVAVADHDDRRARDQQLVVPRATRVGARRVGVEHRSALQRVGADAHREEPPATQDHQVIPRTLDDAPFVDAGGLHVGDRIGAARGVGALRRTLGRGRGRRGRRLQRRHAGRRLPPALALQLLGFTAPARERLDELGLAAIGGKRPGGRRRDRGGGVRNAGRAASGERAQHAGQQQSSSRHGGLRVLGTRLNGADPETGLKPRRLRRNALLLPRAVQRPAPSPPAFSRKREKEPGPRCASSGVPTGRRKAIFTRGLCAIDRSLRAHRSRRGAHGC